MVKKTVKKKTRKKPTVKKIKKVSAPKKAESSVKPSSPNALTKYYKLFIEESKLSLKLQEKILTIESDPAQFRQIFKPIFEGKVDITEKDKIVQNLITFIRKLPEFNTFTSFMKTNASQFKNFYDDVSKTSKEEYQKFLEMQERKVLDAFVERFLTAYQSVVKIEQQNRKQEDDKLQYIG